MLAKNNEEPYQKIYDDFCAAEEDRGVSKATIRTEYSIFRHFFHFIYNQMNSSIESLTFEMLKNYLITLDEVGLAPRTKSLYLSCIKRFLELGEERQWFKGSLSYFFRGQVLGRYRTLPSHYSKEELKKVLSIINRNTAIGKRDYLILLLAMQLGIRVGDIRNLKYENIHLDTNTLQFCQQKTGNQLSLPLNDHLLFALADYLKNARKPSLEYTHIFLKMRAPYIPYAQNNAFHYILMKYLKAAGINYTGRRHGMHSMRHRLAGNMLESGVPLPTISGVLGHTSTVTTMQYTKIDYQQLKRIALEVPV